MSLILIAAVDRRFAIGNRNKLLYNLPEDMKRFRMLTSGHTVILGRKTLDSFPGGKPLPNRKNIVISRNYVNQEQLPDLVVVRSVEDALEEAKGDGDVFVIGGQSIYSALAPFCDRALLTRIDAESDDADAFFPNLDETDGWEIEWESEPFVSASGLRFRYVDYLHKQK